MSAFRCSVGPRACSLTRFADGAWPCRLLRSRRRPIADACRLRRATRPAGATRLEPIRKLPRKIRSPFNPPAVAVVVLDRHAGDEIALQVIADGSFDAGYRGVPRDERARVVGQQLREAEMIEPRAQEDPGVSRYLPSTHAPNASMSSAVANAAKGTCQRLLTSSARTIQ